MRKLSAEEQEFMKQRYFASVAVVSPTTGLPSVTTVWTHYYKGKFYVITRKHRAKYRFIRDGSDKVGINVHAPQGFPYISINGKATIQHPDDRDDFWQLITTIVKKYNPTEDAQQNWLSRMKEAGDRILIELEPENIFSSV